MLGSDPHPAQAVHWKLLAQPQRLTKGYLLIFISGWAPRTVEPMSDLTTIYLPWWPTGNIFPPSDLPGTFPPAPP
jgi:hypothetical protein